MNLVPNKQLLLKVPFQWTKYRKKELCVVNIKTIGDVYCPTCRNEKCVYNSTNETTSFYDCKKCKACCHVLNIPFKDQKPTNMLFGGAGTHCFARKTSSHYEETSPFLEKFLRQSQPSTFEPEKKGWNEFKYWINVSVSYCLMIWATYSFFKSFFFQFQYTVNSSTLVCQHTQNPHDLLSLQRRNPVDSRFWTRLCYYCSNWSRPKYNNQFTRNTPSSLAIALVSKTRLFEQSSSASTNHSQPRRNNGDERRSNLQCGGSRLGH